jgi:hypothetical protein
MEPVGSFPLSHVPNNCSVLSQIDRVHVQITHVGKIQLNIILHFYAWVKQLVSLNQVYLPKSSTCDAKNPYENSYIL